MLKRHYSSKLQDPFNHFCWSPLEWFTNNIANIVVEREVASAEDVSLVDSDGHPVNINPRTGFSPVRCELQFINGKKVCASAWNNPLPDKDTDSASSDSTGLDHTPKRSGRVRFGPSDPPMGFEELSFYQSRSRKVNPNWVLLESQSTINLVCNQSLAKKIRRVNKGVTINCSTGVTHINLRYDLNIFGSSWFMEDGVANILFIKQVSEIYQVTFDSKQGSAFHVHTPSGVISFRQSPKGFYYHDMSDPGSFLLMQYAMPTAPPKTYAEAVSLLPRESVPTVRGNARGLSKRDISATK